MVKKHIFLLLLLAGALALRCGGDVIAKAKGFMLTVEDLKFEIRKMGPSSRYEDTFEGRKAAVGVIWVRRMLADEAERLGLIDKDEIERVMKEAEERQVQEVYHRWKIENRSKVPRIKTKDIRSKLSRRLHLKDVVSRTYKGAEDLVSYLSAGGDFDSLTLRLEGREDFAFRDIGWVLWKETGAEIGCKVFTLLPGEFSGIIRLNDGYHIFLVAEDERFDLRDEIISQRSKRIAKMLETERLVDLERREIGAKYDLRFDQRGIMDAMKAFSSSFSGERPDESLFESIVAVWKGGELYVADLFQYYYSLPERSRLYIGDEHGMIELAYEILMPKLEAQAGYDMGIDRTREIRWHVESARQDLLVPAIEDYYRSKIEVTEQDVRDYYERRKEDLKTARLYRARRLLLSDWEEARIASQRIASGEDFEQLVKAMSKDPYTSVKGGDIGAVAFGVIAVYDSVIANLKIGQISEPFETSSGIEMLKLEEIIEARQLSYEEAIEPITQFITNTRAEVMLAQWIAEKREEVGFTVNEDLLRRVRLPLPEYAEKIAKPSAAAK